MGHLLQLFTCVFYCIRYCGVLEDVFGVVTIVAFVPVFVCWSCHRHCVLIVIVGVRVRLTSSPV